MLAQKDFFPPPCQLSLNLTLAPRGLTRWPRQWRALARWRCRTVRCFTTTFTMDTRGGSWCFPAVKRSGQWRAGSVLCCPTQWCGHRDSWDTVVWIHCGLKSTRAWSGLYFFSFIQKKKKKWDWCLGEIGWWVRSALVRKTGGWGGGKFHDCSGIRLP